MGDDIAAELVTLAFYKTQVAYWEELHALGEDFVSFWEVALEIVGDAGKALNVFDEQLMAGTERLFLLLPLLSLLLPPPHPCPCGSR